MAEADGQPAAHAFTFSGWCSVCGQARSRVVDELLPCRAGPNVVAISATVRDRRFKQLLGLE